MKSTARERTRLTPKPRAKEATGAVAIILARAGSKGVPGKNWAMVGGRPCIEWTVLAARSAALSPSIVLSTDGKKLESIGLSMGIEVVRRPRSLASARASVADAARHALECWERRGGHPPVDSRPVVILYANVPVRPEGLIDRAVGLLRATGADSVQSYSGVGKHHPWWTARVDSVSGKVRPWQGKVLNHGVHRRQDLPPAFVPDGGVLVVTRRALMLQVPGVPGGKSGPHAFFGKDRRGIINDHGSVIDIDSPVDLLVADAVLRGAGGA